MDMFPKRTQGVMLSCQREIWYAETPILVAGYSTKSCVKYIVILHEVKQYL